MHIGLLRLNLHLPAAQSLKDKRRVLLQIRERIKNKFNVSVSEIGKHDKWQLIELAVVMVNSDRVPIEKVFERIGAMMASEPDAVLLDQHVEYL